MHFEDRATDVPRAQRGPGFGSPIPPTRERVSLARVSARFKTVIAAALLIAILATPLRFWPILVVLGAAIGAGYAIGRISLREARAGLGRVLPFLLLLALGVPLSRGFASGWDIAAGVLAKSFLSLAVVRLVAATTEISEIFEALLFFRTPRLLVAVLSLLVRYRFLFADELARMRRAKDSRTFRYSVIREWAVLPNLIGIVFVRALDRAERVHDAMLARGWTGEYHSLGFTRARASDQGTLGRESRGNGPAP